MQTLPHISNKLQQNDEIARTRLITAISGGINCSNIVRKVLSVPSIQVVLIVKIS